MKFACSTLTLVGVAVALTQGALAQSNDRFDGAQSPVVVSGDGNTTASKDCYSCDYTRRFAYSDESFSSGQVTWELEVLSLTDHGHSLGGLIIGLSTSDNPTDASHYGYVHTGRAAQPGSQAGGFDSYAAGDIIAIEFDIDERLMRFYKNGVNQGIYQYLSDDFYAFWPTYLPADQSWRLAVSFLYESSVKVLSRRSGLYHDEHFAGADSPVVVSGAGNEVASKGCYSCNYNRTYAYGAESFSSGQYTWELEVLSLTDNGHPLGGLAIGLSTSDDPTDAEFWGYVHLGRVVQPTGQGGTLTPYAAGDIVAIEFDIDERLMRFYVNGVNQGIYQYLSDDFYAFWPTYLPAGQSWRLAVSFLYESSVKILSRRTGLY